MMWARAAGRLRPAGPGSWGRGGAAPARSGGWRQRRATARRWWRPCTAIWRRRIGNKRGFMSDVLFEMAGQVAVLRLNRPEQLNALTPAMLDLLRETLGRAVSEG